MHDTPDSVFEPRVLWSTARYEAVTRTTRQPPNRIRLTERDFLNGEHYPITLRYLLLDTPGVLMDTFDAAPPISADFFRQTRAAMLDRVDVTISARGLRHFARYPHALRAMGKVPTDEPRLSDADAEVGATNVQRNARLFNTFRWTFDKKMRLPPDAVIQAEFSAIADFGLLAAEYPKASLAFHQAGGGFANGSARVQPFTLVPGARANLPFPIDALQTQITGAGAGPTWPSTTRFNERNFLAQNTCGAGSANVMSGFSVAFDQRAWEDAVAAALPFAPTGGVIGSVGNLIGCRMRVPSGNGGSGAYWWREGAPLSLVCPTMTTAHVYPLAQPITLEPGQSLEVELEFPEAVVIDPESGPLNTTYLAGVALAGEAKIYG